jgi:hypothetical protein
MDNIEAGTAVADNSNAQATGSAEAGLVTSTQDASQSSAAVSPATQTSTGGWKSSLRTDLKDSPLAAKFEDTPDGLNKALESYGNLEKLLGHEKVPIPKDANDVEGWNRFSKAMGIPDKAEGYGLSDVEVPAEMQGLEFDKNKFAEIAHAHKLTPAQAQGIWESYTRNSMDGYKQVMEEQNKSLTETVNRLRGEWGDAYQSKVEMGQMVINKFAGSKEANDFVTATLCKSPDGIKFLAKIGEQFAENKVGEFQMARFSLAPEQAREEIQKIVRDPNHPYNSHKATEREHQAAIDYVNALHATVAKAGR